MTPINQPLHAALSRKFGKVRITGTGVEGKYQVVEDPIASWAAATGVSDLQPAKRINVMNWGETYAVDCPRCNDRRGRLYIGHLWGTYCEKAGARITSCVKCHNESCWWGDLWNVLYGNNYDPGYRQKAEDMKTGVEPDSRRMELPGDVDDLVPVNLLDDGHPVVQYLRSRGFDDLKLLAGEYQFCYCTRSPWKKRFTDSGGNWHTVTPENRLIIPNVQHGVWQGWMARYIGEIPRDPTTSKPVIQKYLNAPGYSFSSSVYRLEDARKFTGGDFVMVCEGALSAIACGFAGVGTFGMYPKPMQEELLAQAFPHGTFVFMVEAEAHDNGRVYDVMDRLRSRTSGNCVAVRFSKGEDPASVGSVRLMQMVQQAVSGQ